MVCVALDADCKVPSNPFSVSRFP